RFVKTFVLNFETGLSFTGIWFSIDDQRQDSIFPTEPFEGLDFLAYPARGSRARRTDHDQITRFTQRFIDIAAQIRRDRQLFPIAKNREQTRRDGTVA